VSISELCDNIITRSCQHANGFLEHDLSDEPSSPRTSFLTLKVSQSDLLSVGLPRRARHRSGVVCSSDRRRCQWWALAGEVTAHLRERDSAKRPAFAVGFAVHGQCEAAGVLHRRTWVS